MVDVAPSPNTHAHEVGVLVDVSVNCTASGAVPDVTLEVNDATGMMTGGVVAVTVVVVVEVGGKVTGVGVGVIVPRYLEVRIH